MSLEYKNLKKKVVSIDFKKKPLFVLHTIIELIDIVIQFIVSLEGRLERI